MTLMSSISKLTTSVDQLTGEANVTKAALDAKVALADAEVVAAQAEQAATEAARDEAAAHAATAATHLATVKAGVTYQGIAAILAEKAVTAVDVFVYDTSLDSDGGAWRKRCQHTSWLNEPLNTATRGARREFPAVAVIVAESNKVTIYDGDDPTLPMWMVFNGVYNNAITSVPLTSLAAVNGTVVLGTDQGTDTTGSALVLNFLSEKIVSRRPFGSTQRGNYLGNILQRNSASGWDVSTDQSIVAQPVNDVAITVLPNAPIDPATWLPVPTIAVATAGGVSVIKDDGTVVSGGELNSGWAVTGLFFDGDATLWATEGTAYSGLQRMSVPPFSSVEVIGGPMNGGYGYPYYNPSTANTYGAPQNAPKLRQGGWLYGKAMSAFGNMFAAGNTAGISKVLHNSASQLTSLVNYTTSTYNTGWMNGSIKGAWLADTDEGDLIEATFADDFTFYADQAAAEAASWSFIGTEFDAGLDAIVFNGTGSANATLSGITLSNAGITDRFEVTVVVSGVTAGSISVQENFVTIGSFAASGTYAFRGVRAGSFRFVTANGFDGAIENVTFKALDADRSVNNKGLVVSGSITRSPVADGAELVAYAGFSASNYLQQPYNSALDFGTGDFCVMGWVKQNSSATAQIAHRADIAGVGGGVLSVWNSSVLGLSLDISDDNLATKDTVNEGSQSPTGVWRHAAFARSGQNILCYINGVLKNTKAVSNATGGLNNSTAVLRVGLAAGGGYPLIGSLALLRISATAPTAEQIAKIYEDERKLFQPGAQCTLYGTSDAVTALAHDPKNNLLHVGTSAGRSTFDGLQRVANTETPVATAISAVNGLIAEQ